MERIPVEIWVCIRSFCVDPSDINNVFRANRWMSTMCERLVYRKLNCLQTQKFVWDRKYRSKLLDKIPDPAYQISVGMDFFRGLKQFACFQNLYHVDLSYTGIEDKDLVYLKNIIHLSLDGTEITHLTGLHEKVERLNIRNCRYLYNTRVKLFLKLYYVDFSATPLTEINCFREARVLISNINLIHIGFFFPTARFSQSFSNLIRLCLNNCDFLTNIDGFENIPELSLSRCMNIQSFRNLGTRNVSLNLSSTLIRDEEMKCIMDRAHGNLNFLDLSYCPNISNAAILRGVRNLRMYGMTQILHNVHELYQSESLVIFGSRTLLFQRWRFLWRVWMLRHNLIN